MRKLVKKAAVIMALIILLMSIFSFFSLEHELLQHEHDAVTRCAVCCIINSANELLFTAITVFFVFFSLIYLFVFASSTNKCDFSPITPVTLKVKLSD